MSSNRQLALDAANIADQIFYTSMKTELNGERVCTVPYKRAEEMKEILLKISNRLNDIADAEDR